MNRRDFFKKVMLGGFAAGFTGVFQSSAEGEVLDDKPEWQEPGWKKTIYCDFDRQELEKAIMKCADEIGCEVVFGEGPDILVRQFFVAIVDRTLICEVTWDFYVDCCNEDKDAALTLIVDDIDDLNLPRINASCCNVDEFQDDPDFELDTVSHVVELVKRERDRIVTKGEKTRRLAGKIRKT
jgi:hypothetical protein